MLGLSIFGCFLESLGCFTRKLGHICPSLLLFMLLRSDSLSDFGSTLAESLIELTTPVSLLPVCRTPSESSQDSRFVMSWLGRGLVLNISHHSCHGCLVSTIKDHLLSLSKLSQLSPCLSCHGWPSHCPSCSGPPLLLLPAQALLRPHSTCKDKSSSSRSYAKGITRSLGSHVVHGLGGAFLCH